MVCPRRTLVAGDTVLTKGRKQDTQSEDIVDMMDLFKKKIKFIIFFKWLLQN